MRVREARRARHDESPRIAGSSCWDLVARRGSWSPLVRAGRERDRRSTSRPRSSAATIHDVVEATGTINAVVTVQVGSQVSGTIARLNADFNSRVAEGRRHRAHRPGAVSGRRLQAAADLENARANAVGGAGEPREGQGRSRCRPKRTTSATVELAQTENVAQPAAARPRAAPNDDSARRRRRTRPRRTSRRPRRRSNRRRPPSTVARTNLDYTVIRSPIDGIVVARNVDVGQTVAASLQAPTIFTIAQDLTKMLVYAKTDESDVGRIRTGTARHVQGGRVSEGDFSGVVEPGAHEPDDGPERRHLRHDHRVRESRPEAVPRHDGLRDDSRRDRRRRRRRFRTRRCATSPRCRRRRSARSTPSTGIEDAAEPAAG